MILVTGFEAFDGRSKNGSATCASHLDGFDTGHGVVNSQTLPVAWSEIQDYCENAIAQSDATMIIGIGEADCPRPRFERQAKLHARGIDNKGCPPPPLNAAGDSLSVQTIACETLSCDREWFDDLTDQTGAGMDISWDAGAYLCNWYLLHTLKHARVAAGFVHVPLQRSRSDSDYLHRNIAPVKRFIEKNAQKLFEQAQRPK